jgi:hypothetical protein
VKEVQPLQHPNRLKVQQHPPQLQLLRKVREVKEVKEVREVKEVKAIAVPRNNSAGLWTLRLYCP